jgi:hypothetical protein
MDKRLRLACRGAACIFLLALLLTACEIPTRPTEICDWLDMPVIEYGSPANFSIIDDLRPTFTWTIDPASTCVPAQYNIQVWSALNYLPGASAGYLILAGTSTIEQFHWPADGPALLPGHSYYVYINQAGTRDGELVQTGGVFGYFSTGPICSASAPLSAPRLHWPPDGWRVDPTSAMYFEWDSSMTCWPDHNFSFEISKSEAFIDPILEFGDYPLEAVWLYSFMGIPWENCTRYYWRVRPNMLGVEDEPFSETWSFVTQPGDSFCPPDLIGPLIPPETVLPPSVRLLMDTPCRSGLTQEAQVLDLLAEGSEHPVQGRNQAGDAWLVDDSNIARSCWVQAEKVELIGDASLVEVIDPEPPTLPTALVRQTANCRAGPTLEYPVLDILTAGTQLLIQGQNRAGDSWLVEDSNIHGNCWVYGGWVDVLGDTSLVMIINPDPPTTPTPKPTSLSCRDYSDEPSCTKAGCTWDHNYQPKAICK